MDLSLAALESIDHLRIERYLKMRSKDRFVRSIKIDRRLALQSEDRSSVHPPFIRTGSVDRERGKIGRRALSQGLVLLSKSITG